MVQEFLEWIKERNVSHHEDFLPYLNRLNLEGGLPFLNLQVQSFFLFYVDWECIKIHRVQTQKNKHYPYYAWVSSFDRDRQTLFCKFTT